MSDLLQLIKNEAIEANNRHITLVPFDCYDQRYLTELYLAEWYEDPEVIRFAWGTTLFPWLHVPEGFDELKSRHSSEKVTTLVINYDDQPIGDIQVYTSKLLRHYEMGYMLGNRNYWGRGIAFDVSSSLIKYISNEHPDELDELFITTSILNDPALALADKLLRHGFFDDTYFKFIGLSQIYYKSFS
jgi:RimJ/RimL family protein N-acetyltransferase